MKQSIRAFSLGIFCATFLLASVYYLSDHRTDEPSELSTGEMIQSLEQRGYYISHEQPPDQNEQPEQKQNDPEMETKQSEDEQPEMDKKPEVIEYTLTIETGMSVSTIVEQLVDNKIISDREEFSTFLNDNDYSTKIQIGEFNLTSDMNQKEIADIITNQ